MTKFVSEIVQPHEVGRAMTEMAEKMLDEKTHLVRWSTNQYWASDLKHDLILVVMEFYTQ